ncbi:hypothetical protein [Campylobacter volucris]|uniref:hypothetical protein n=1 Tax=Campylobacter volucris TaxID=1031542 RepID=UPI0021C2ACB3|nr:hypothetical protein [Campylobacter volucris]
MSYNKYSFDIFLQKIINTSNYNVNYIGRKEEINILPRLFQKYYDGKQFETHLQVYILQEFYKTKFFGLLSNEYIEWLGNEVGCGVGMQSIDIMASSSINMNGLIFKKVIPVELKSCEVYPEVLFQMQRYINWLNQYYISNHQSFILPVIICRKTDKSSMNYEIFYKEAQNFSVNNNILPLIYMEFFISENQIQFERIF